MNPDKTYRAIKNPLNTMFPASQATFIVDPGDGEYYFLPAYSAEVVKKGN